MEVNHPRFDHWTCEYIHHTGRKGSYAQGKKNVDSIPPLTSEYAYVLPNTAECLTYHH